MVILDSMILRHPHQGLRAVGLRKDTYLRLWAGYQADVIHPLGSRSRDDGDEAYEVLTREEAATWGSRIYRVREDRSLQEIGDDE